MAEDVAATEIERIRDRLRHRAWVFDDPASYRAGVEECLAALVALDPATGATPGTSNPRHRSRTA